MTYTPNPLHPYYVDTPPKNDLPVGTVISYNGRNYTIAKKHTRNYSAYDENLTRYRVPIRLSFEVVSYGTGWLPEQLKEKFEPQLNVGQEIIITGSNQEASNPTYALITKVNQRTYRVRLMSTGEELLIPFKFVQLASGN